ncbi:MAG: PepSY-associated TM helix domain-containing protein, partial [Cyclobacteriaceae bacterium]
MKLKGPGNRIFNILFHTHTVAGIVISFALFIIFYAGAFSLFKDELYLWENQEARTAEIVENPDYEKIVAAISANYLDFKATEDFTFRPANESMPNLT